MSEDNNIIAEQKRVIELQSETISLLELLRDELKTHVSVLLALNKNQAEIIDILVAENVGIVAMIKAFKQEAEEHLALVVAKPPTDTVN